MTKPDAIDVTPTPSYRKGERSVRVTAVTLAVLLLTATLACAQAKPEEKPKTFLEEISFFAYVENSYVWNLGHTGRDDVNELRVFDFDAGYSFNMAQFSVKKDPSERYPFGFGLALAGGLDAQKIHAIGIFRDDDDAYPFRNTPKIDLKEAYASYQVPVGSGLTLKAGKFVTLLGSEVIDGPLNPNFSRSYLFGFAIPFTHVGALASYAFTDWFSVTAGPVVGWDVADDNNDELSWMGQFALTPIKDVTTSLSWITGPEQFDSSANRTVLDLVVNYTAIKNLSLGLNIDYGWEGSEAALVASGTRSDATARWWGWAGYAVYDWTEKLRTAARVEYFQDSAGVRTLAIAPGSKVSLWEATATLQYKIWKGLVGRLEYRHDSADEKVFKIRTPDLVPTSKTQDTITLALHYLFF